MAMTKRMPLINLIIKENFNCRVISRNWDVNWLPRLYDLTPLDYFFVIRKVRFIKTFHNQLLK